MVRLIFRHRCALMAIKHYLVLKFSMALQDVRQHLPGVWVSEHIRADAMLRVELAGQFPRCHRRRVSLSILLLSHCLRYVRQTGP